MGSSETSPKILYIDDDPANRTLINRLLVSQNFRVIEATNGLEGIKIARQETPDLILMDINMPGLDGYETTTRMRSIPALDNVPIVALTARTTKGARELALAAGCNGYITKPIDIDEFPQQVTAYLQGRRDTISRDEHTLYLDQYNRILVERLESKIVELEEVNNRLQKIDKLKSDFITVAAHELRTPITLVYGYASLLQVAAKKHEDEADEGSISDLAERIYLSIHRLNEVINDILNISLVEADQMRMEYQLVNLAAVIDVVLIELDPTKNDRVLEITLEGLDELPTLIGDNERLRQVFWNLLSNAIKFTPDGGTILISGEEVDAETSPVKGRGGIVIAVKDSGIGIARSDHKEIFERFYTVRDPSYHTTSKTAFCGGGMGLGLTIARGIVNSHGGRIWVESPGYDMEHPPGSVFYVFLPRQSNRKN